MSAPIDPASQGGATGLRSVPGESAEVEIQSNLTSTGDGGSPPASAVTAVAAAAPPPSAASSVASKRTAEPVTTARSAKKGRKKSAADKIGKGKQVYCKKGTLYHILPSTEVGLEQRKVLQGLPPGQCLFGTVVGGNGKSCYTVKFDMFPQGRNELVVNRKQLTVIRDGADEPDFEYGPASDDELDDTGKPKKLTPEQQSIADFKALGKNVLEEAKRFSFAFGKKDDEKIDWEILPDDQHVTDMPFEPPTELDYNVDIPWETKEDRDYNKVFFDHFFPSIKGYGKILDEYLG